jgi:solute carrier family 35 (GDP-fucose transporter), member C1
MVLPFTVATSFIALHARPSLRILLSCTIVTFGFFIGVFLDGTSVSMTGVGFGVASSVITAVHSVVIKKSLELVKGNALHLSWYSNLLSAFLLAPIVVLAGEGPAVTELFMGEGAIVPPGATTSELTTFIWGSAITVRIFFYPGYNMHVEF